MKYASCLGKVSAIILCLFLVDGSGAQGRNRHEINNSANRICPWGNRCVETSRCRPSFLSPVRKPPVDCGRTYNLEKKICCSQRRIKPVPTYDPTYTESRNIEPTYTKIRNTGPTYNNRRDPEPTYNNRRNPQSTLNNRRNPEKTNNRKNPEPTYNNGRNPEATLNNRRNPEATLNSRNHEPTYNRRTPQPTYNNRRNPESECGLVSGSGKISALRVGTGGKEAKQGDWPWMVAIAMRDQNGTFTHHCTGVMITRIHVLSAAHCFQERDPSLYVARIGHVNQTLADVYGISQLDVPETYNPKQFYDDIAVLTLSRDVNAEYVRSICLPKSPENANSTVKKTTAAGWGATELYSTSSPVLIEVLDLPVIPNRRCNILFSSRLLSFRKDFPRGITDGFICAGVLKGENDTCEGDSGGPLMSLHGDNWFVVGVAAFGVKCGFPGLPGGYTNVAKYLSWILQHTRT